MVEVGGPLSFFCMRISSYPNTVSQRDYSYPLTGIAILVKNQLAMDVWVYF